MNSGILVVWILCIFSGFIISLLKPYFPVIISKNRYSALVNRSYRLEKVHNLTYKENPINADTVSKLSNLSRREDYYENSCEHFFGDIGN